MDPLSAIRIALAFITSPVGRWVGVGALVVMAYFAGDIRGRRIEHAKCEKRAEEAAAAAVAQDRSAKKSVEDSTAATLQELKQSKDAADARVQKLEKTMADGIVDCVYGDNGQPAGRVRDNAGKGAGDAPNPRPSRLPTPRPRPAGH